MKKAGISKSLVCSCATTEHQVSSINDMFYAESLAHKEFVCLGTLHPAMDNPYAEIDKIVKYNLKGIKLHPDFQKFNIDDERMIDVYKYIAKCKLPVLFHTGDDRYDYSSPKRLRRVVDKVPDLKCTAAHLGGYRKWDEAKKYLVHENVYVDTCSSLYFLPKEMSLELLDIYGEDKVLFGTDFPMQNATDELKLVESLNLSEEFKEKLFYKNFISLYGE